MSNISITELKVNKLLPDVNDRIDLAKGLGAAEIAIKFNIQPIPTGAIEIQIAIYDDNNQLIYWLHHGSRTYHYGETVYASIPAILPAKLNNIRVESWITDNTIIGTKNTGWGPATEKNRISNIATKSLSLAGTVYYDTGSASYKIKEFDRTRGQVQTQVTTQGIAPFTFLPEAAAQEMPITTPYQSIKQNFVDMKITKNGKIQGRIDFTALGFNESFKAGQTVTNIFQIKSIDGVDLGYFPESYLKFGQSETLDMIEHRDIIGYSAYNQNELIIESFVWNSVTNPIALAPPIKQRIVKEAPIEPISELITTGFQVKLNNILQFSSTLSNADYKRLQDEMILEPKITLVFLNQTDIHPISTFSKMLRDIQKLLEGQVVETITPTGETITETTTTTPTGETITETTTTTPTGETITETRTTGKKGLMGAGVLGVIGILMLGGFIADHVRKRR